MDDILGVKSSNFFDYRLWLVFPIQFCVPCDRLFRADGWAGPYCSHLRTPLSENKFSLQRNRNEVNWMWLVEQLFFYYLIFIQDKA